MSYYLIDFSKKNNDFNFDNIIIGKKIKLDKDNCKYYLYYQNEQTETPNEIYIKLPKIRLIYNISNYKYDRLSIPIYPNWELSNSFISWIHNFETNIQNCFSTNKIKREFISIISKKNIINFIGGYIAENVKITSNIDDKKITLNDFKINGQIEIVLKLSYIWANNIKYGLSSSIYQIKYHGPPEQLEINFIDPEPPIKSIILTKPIHSLNCKQNTDTIINKNQEQIVNQQISSKIIPSLKDLQKAIKSLKPVEDN